MLKYTLNTFGSLEVNNRAHKAMLKSLVRVQLGYFEDHSSGYLLSRFSNDLQIMDFQNTFTLFDIWELSAFFLFSIVTLLVIQPWFIFPVLAILYGNYFMFKFAKSIIIQS
jgi:ATP-binding cassette subfamily C (CFTR/MRP) protein 4